LNLEDTDGGDCPVVGEVGLESSSPTTGQPRPCWFMSMNQRPALSAIPLIDKSPLGARQSLVGTFSLEDAQAQGGIAPADTPATT